MDSGMSERELNLNLSKLEQSCLSNLLALLDKITKH